jgi:SAM-dependent methyltransferase
VNPRYLIPRVLRHFMPEPVARFLLKRRWIIRPGLESSDPVAAAARYAETLTGCGEALTGKRVLVFGYGGRFAVGVELLRLGASHVVLCDHIEALDQERNLELLPAYAEYLVTENATVRPRKEFITLLHGDITSKAIQNQINQVDCVLSTSVYEHLDGVEAITRALASLTKPDGIHIHFVDLRDHFFKYPFEMLRFSEGVWRGWLNPTSHHNRYRLWDYRKAFEESFEKVEIEVLEREQEKFRKLQPHIRPEFVSGKIEDDAVTLIRVISFKPRSS